MRIGGAERIAAHEVNRRHANGRPPREQRVGVGRSACLPQVVDTVRILRIRPHQRLPTAVESRNHAVDLVHDVRAVFRLPQIAGRGVEVQAEAVANAVGEDLAHARAQRKERVVRRRRAVIVNAKDDPGRIGGRSVREVLELPVAIQVADDAVELAVGAEENDSAVVVRPRRRWQPENAGA